MYSLRPQMKIIEDLIEATNERHGSEGMQPNEHADDQIFQGFGKVQMIEEDESHVDQVEDHFENLEQQSQGTVLNRINTPLTIMDKCANP